jgi:uncharacterized SAM-binding protein YcdF (DUF218 family)
VLRVLGAATLGAFFTAAFTPLSNALNSWLSVKPDLRAGDAIVVLGSGVHPGGVLSERSIAHALHGIALWRRGLAPVLLFSGPGTSGGPSEACARLELARQLGLPAEGMLADSAGLTTRGEARSVRRLLQPRSAHRILLVTDARHLSRAREAFLRVGFEVIPAPPPDFLGAAASPQARLLLTRRLVEEMLARTYYWLTEFR